MKTFCISHRKDVDGLGAAALIVAATGAEVALSDYDDLVSNLKSVPADADQVVLCDLGTDNADLEDFMAEVKRIATKAKFTYVDHHAMSGKTKSRLKRAGVRVVHDERECSSVLAFKTYRAELPAGAQMIALCGAVTDYMDGSPLARRMMEQSDRQYVLLEATMLSYALSRRANVQGFAERVVEELSKMRHPHEIEGVPAASVEQLVEMTSLADRVKKGGKKMGRLAYMVTDQYSTGNVAKMLIGAFDVPLGVALKEKNKGWYEVSLRSTSECKLHLGRALSRLSARLGGSGGGHARAAGCRVPVSQADQLLLELSKKA